MNGTIKVIGGRKLVGEVTPIINKNSLMGALPIAMLNCGGIRFKDLPSTSDVENFLRIYETLGAEIVKTDDNFTLIDSKNIKSSDIDEILGKKFRGAFTFAGPLLARFGHAKLPVPGGCKLGMRSIATHVNGFSDLGVTYNYENGSIFLIYKNKGILRKSIWLMEASVTATINIAIFASAIDSEVEIIDAACEPHVVDVLKTLVKMGAKIEGIGTNKLFIKGTQSLKSTDFEASPDFVDIGGYIVAAAITGGKIRIKGANIPYIVDGIIKWMELFGVDIKREDKDLVVKGDKKLVIQKDKFPQAGRDLPKFTVRPWPGFPVDLLPVMVTLATKAQGSMLFQNWMYESGFDFVRELNYMGAEIFMSDPQKIIVMEPIVEYIGGEVAAPGIIQGTKAIFLAALADPVQTIIHGTDILRRRYPSIVEIYRSLGAIIEKLS
ncbi:MAG: UDP-N-acetylglucosamine 1-carboxyvinyltransferase [Spirochaetes bacterium]|nr:UDP-N-acetylglucosamine 1-carboxyvinyltransferase [Spirochaetota bacterium]